MFQASNDFDIWLFLAGLGLFLFGMHTLEKGLEGLAGRSFKRMLQSFTNKKYKGILTGTFVTAVLQSSSLVNLLVLALLGVRMITFQNSLGVILGANLGTTATAWLVATIGFKFSISKLSFPFLAIGILSYLMIKKRPILSNSGLFLMGFGLLFLGLDFMKFSVESLSGQFDFKRYVDFNLFVFLLIGVVITAIIQSSSATIVMVLSLFNSGVVDVYQSVALIIGANIGTTSTIVLASIGGTADKKRLAIANVLFNIVAGGISFVLIRQLVFFTHKFLIEDMLMDLVLINTLINLIGIILFYPFLERFGNFLKKLFKDDEQKGYVQHINNVSSDVPDLAIRAIREDLKEIYNLVTEFIKDCLGIAEGESKDGGKLWEKILKKEPDVIEKYNRLKVMADEITIFYKKIQEHNLTEAESTMLSMYMEKLRSMVYAAKYIKDIVRNVNEIEESEDKIAKDVIYRLREFVAQTINRLSRTNINDYLHYLSDDFLTEMEQFYRNSIEYLYKNLDISKEREIPLSTITNIVRKTVSSLEALSISKIE